jgi:hypothetical protein
VGSVAPHRFFLLSFPGIRDHLVLNAPEDHTAVEKAPPSLRFAGALQSTACYNAIIRVINSLLNYRENAESAGDK